MRPFRPAVAVPKVSQHEVNFGRGDYLPERAAIPPQFFDSSNPFHEKAYRWARQGLRHSEIIGKHKSMDLDGVLAIKALLNYSDAEMDHIIAGAAYLMSEWFYIVDDSVKN